MANIDVKLLREKLYPVAKALFCMGEVCVDVSKCHISEEEAIKRIRGYLQDANLYSRHKVDQLIDECMIYDYLEDKEHLTEKAQEYLRELNYPVQRYNLDMPSSCDGCSNNPKNGGSGICNCTIPYFENPIMYSATCADDSSCVANNITGQPFISGEINLSSDNIGVADVKRIAKAITKANGYEKRI